jgi:putative membrane protein
MFWLLLGAGVLHVFFMLGELFPWPLPLLLRRAGERVLTSEPFTKDQKRLVATIVHNAGIYNGIVAGGLFWAAFGGSGATDVARVMLAGALVAGVFGAATFRSPVPAAQAIVGLIGLSWLSS